MQEDLLTGILKDYDQTSELHEEFTSKVKDLIVTLLNANNLRVHSISSRLKGRESLKLKLKRPDCDYKQLKDVTDICGIRIITYFADEVDSVASVIKNEFEIDIENSIDKRVLLDPDRFGYLSIHYIARLSPKRKRLTEYKRFSKYVVEIQIRSILQHTWAEIEHDLGYKSKISVPKELQRRFYQLAGLLELADQDFTQLRNELYEYKYSISRQIEEHPESITIDAVSLAAFIAQSPLLKKIEQRIRRDCNVLLSGIDSSSMLLQRLYAVGFETIQDINNSLIKHEELVLHFAKHILGVNKEEEYGWSRGIGLFLLCYAEIACENSINSIYEFFKEIIKGLRPKIPDKELRKESKRIFDIYNLYQS